MFFKNRFDAGQKLAQALKKYQHQPVLLYALPRGGVVIGAVIAKFLHVPLNLIIPRKIVHPLSPEYAICAVTETGPLLCNSQEKRSVDQVWLKKAVEEQRQEAKRRRILYLKNQQKTAITNQTVIIVDDGIATGLTMMAAIKDIKNRGAKKIVVAVPVTPKETAQLIKKDVDELIALEEPILFLGAIGAYYQDFSQVEDEEVISIINEVN